MNGAARQHQKQQRDRIWSVALGERRYYADDGWSKHARIVLLEPAPETCSESEGREFIALCPVGMVLYGVIAWGEGSTMLAIDSPARLLAPPPLRSPWSWNVFSRHMRPASKGSSLYEFMSRPPAALDEVLFEARVEPRSLLTVMTEGPIEHVAVWGDLP